jgi:hypothetical protein
MKSRILTIVFALSFVPALAAMRGHWPAAQRGWVVALNFSFFALMAFAGRVGIRRRRLSIAMGAMMLACGIRFGITFGDPPWRDKAELPTAVVLLLTFFWMLAEARHARFTGEDHS